MEVLNNNQPAATSGNKEAQTNNGDSNGRPAMVEGDSCCWRQRRSGSTVTVNTSDGNGTTIGNGDRDTDRNRNSNTMRQCHH